MMLFEGLSMEERLDIMTAANELNADDEGPIRDVLNRIAWARILQKWNDKIWSFWIFKTFRYRDLEFVWVALFGPRPA